MAKFKRSGSVVKGSDATGKVIVKITLQDDDGKRISSVVKGNLTRTIVVEDAKVSDVGSEIDSALFEDDSDD